MNQPDTSLTLRSRTYRHPEHLDAFFDDPPSDGQRIFEKLVWPRYTVAQPDRENAIVLAEFRADRADIAFLTAEGITTPRPLWTEDVRRLSTAYFSERLRGRYAMADVRWYTYGFHGDGTYDVFIRYDLSDLNDAERWLGGTMGFAFTPEESLHKAVVAIPEILVTTLLASKDEALHVLELQTLLDYRP